MNNLTVSRHHNSVKMMLIFKMEGLDADVCKGSILLIQVSEPQSYARKTILCLGSGNMVTSSDPPDTFEPRYEKTGFLHMRKQRRRSASR